MPNNVLIKGGIFAGLLLLALAIGCTSVSMSDFSKKSNQPDPETGIVSWINAINNKDIARVYDLEPDEFKQKISLNQFVSANKDNSFMGPNSTITGYTIVNKTNNATVANLVVVVYWQGPISPNSTKMQTLPIYYKFEEFYEDDEWKIWIEPWQ